MKNSRRLAVPSKARTRRTPYPEFDVASPDKWAYDWDEKTRRLVLDRIENVPEFRFFSSEEAALLEAVIACLIPQADRLPDERIPIAPWIDQRLAEGKARGYRYETMPSDRDAYRLGLKGVDQTAQMLCGRPFRELSTEQQNEVVRRLAEGDPPGEVWQNLPAEQFFQLLMSDVVDTYYAHPSAWAEIGFNGPASPRGHIRLQLDRRDPWEAKETRPRSSVEIVRRRRGKEGGEAKGGPTH